MNKNIKLFLITLTIFLIGCSHLITATNDKNRLVNKQETSIEEGLKQIGIGIGEMKKALNQSGTEAGLYVDTIDLDLILSSTQNEHGQLVLGVNPIDFKSLSKNSAKIDTDIYKEIIDSRNNTIKIRFKSTNFYNLEMVKLDKPTIYIPTKPLNNDPFKKEIEKKIILENIKKSWLDSQ